MPESIQDVSAEEAYRVTHLIRTYAQNVDKTLDALTPRLSYYQRELSDSLYSESVNDLVSAFTTIRTNAQNIVRKLSGGTHDIAWQEIEGHLENVSSTLPTLESLTNALSEADTTLPMHRDKTDETGLMTDSKDALITLLEGLIFGMNTTKDSLTSSGKIDDAAGFVQGQLQVHESRGMLDHMQASTSPILKALNDPVNQWPGTSGVADLLSTMASGTEQLRKMTQNLIAH